MRLGTTIKAGTLESPQCIEFMFGYILSVNLYKTVKSLCTSNMGHL